MTGVKKARIETTKSKPEKRDILTEMFEHFVIEVVDVKGQILKSNKRKKLK